jgi:hypothetical protein
MKIIECTLPWRVEKLRVCNAGGNIPGNNGHKVRECRLLVYDAPAALLHLIEVIIAMAMLGVAVQFTFGL